MNDTLAVTYAHAAADRAGGRPEAEHQARMDQPLVSYRDGGMPPGAAPPPAPAFMFGPSDADLTRQIYGQVETPEIGVTSIADAGAGTDGDRAAP